MEGLSIRARRFYLCCDWPERPGTLAPLDGGYEE